jgi:hypothetical protein
MDRWLPWFEELGSAGLFVVISGLLPLAVEQGKDCDKDATKENRNRPRSTRNRTHWTSKLPAVAVQQIMEFRFVTPRECACLQTKSSQEFG